MSLSELKAWDITSDADIDIDATTRGRGFIISAEDTDVIDIPDENSSYLSRSKLTEKQMSTVPVQQDRSRNVQIIKQIFAGVVSKIEGDEITAIITDISNSAKPDEEVVFDIDEIDPKDFEILKVGAQFHWHIGYEQGDKTPKRRFSIIRFRRLPHWKQADIRLSEQIAEKYMEFFGSD